MRRFLLENNQFGWQKRQQPAPQNKKVVFVLTTFDGKEYTYDDFWDAVIDAEDKYCVEANMVDGYFQTTDEDGLSSFDPVYKSNDDAPYDGHWTEEEGVITEPSMSYEDYVNSTGLTEAGIFPQQAARNASWVSRAPVQQTTSQQQTTPPSAPTSQGTSTQTTQPQPKQQSTAKMAYKKTQMTAVEQGALAAAASAENSILYSLLLAKLYMDRLATTCGLNIYSSSYAGFYDVANGGIADLCQDVEENEAWPTIQEAEAHFKQLVGRAMTSMEKLHMTHVLRVLDEHIAPDGVCEVFLNAGDFFTFRASNWLDSECDYDDYDYAFTLGWNGKQEDDWYDMMGGQYNHAAEYLEMAYSYGVDSHDVLGKICVI